MLLDKTGTITIGNRKATQFHPCLAVAKDDFVKAAALSSVADETPEGKSIIELSQLKSEDLQVNNPHYINFTAETRSSGVDFDDTRIRKGAYDAIKKLTEKAGNVFPKETEEAVISISENGGTPLVVSLNEK